MKPLRQSLALGVLTVALSFSGLAQAPAADLVPRFEGYSMLGNEAFFSLTLRREGIAVRSALARVGETFNGLTIVRFERERQLLVVRDASGREQELLMPQAQIVDTGDGATKAYRRSKAAVLAEIERFRQQLVREYGVTTVVVDLDGSLAPAERLKNYAKLKANAESKGQFLYPVSVNGTWVNVYVHPTKSRPSAEQLAGLRPEHAEELKLLWRIAHAELGGHTLTQPRDSVRRAAAK